MHGPTAVSRLLLAPDRGHHCFYAKDVQRPSQIVDERRQTEFGADFFEATHEKGTLIHPLLDRSKRMLDDLAAPVDKIGPRRYPLFHTIEGILVLKARDRAVIVCASRAALKLRSDSTNAREERFE